MHEDSPGNNRLVAYLVPKNGATPSAAEISLDLRRQLPEYKVPGEYVILPELPRTPNGKIDRKTLPTPNSENAQVFATSGIAPRNEMERTLAVIWKEALGLENVGVRDDFFSLGGHSLLAVKMFAKISSALGIELPLNALLESPTIEQLATLISAPAESDHTHLLVPIQEEGTKPPLYWIPGGRAISVLALREVSLLFGPDQPVYGLESRLPESGEEFASVAERAEHYIKRIRTIQLRGPYYIAGFCTGGMVAYEMAQQLHAQGEEVAFLGLVQAMVPGYPKTKLARAHFHLRRWRYIVATFMRALLLRLTPNFLGISRENRQQALDGVAKLVLGWVGTSAQLPDPTQTTNQRVMQKYKPVPYNGRADLFLAEDCYETIGVGTRLDSRRSWSELVTGGCTVQLVPGNHYSMLTSPNAARLAEAMQLRMYGAGQGDAGRPLGAAADDLTANVTRVQQAISS
jgi:thioesterase domain-containing protein/acyl carrier protein